MQENEAISFQVSVPTQPMTAALYVVATPLGNLADVTLRALGVLAACKHVAAEDTRHTQRLLNHYGLQARLLAAHEHNERQAASSIVRLLAAGEPVALLSDAGTPAISDPGAVVVSAVRAAGYAVIPVPGPCAAIAALSVAGLDKGGFRFVGFLPAQAAQRRRSLETFKHETEALVFYEAPHRIAATLADLAATLGGGRTLTVARELTKRHEQVVVMPLAEAGAWLAEDINHQRGEFVLVVAGALEVQALDEAGIDRVLAPLVAELPVKQAARLAAAITGQSKNALYGRALALRQAAGTDAADQDEQA